MTGDRGEARQRTDLALAKAAQFGRQRDQNGGRDVGNTGQADRDRAAFGELGIGGDQRGDRVVKLAQIRLYLVKPGLILAACERLCQVLCAVLLSLISA